MSFITGERDFLERLRLQVSHASRSTHETQSPSALRLGIGDDCAILRPPRGHEILVTTDFSLETIHFRRDWHSPESAGHRCLARGLSDLAAMGARPLAAFLSLALPVELVQSRKGPSWRDRFLDGFLRLANRYQVPLAGGDTAQTPWIRPHLPSFLAGHSATGLALADIVLIGSAAYGRALRRSGAQAGDRIYVTGFLGGAAAELASATETPGRLRKVISNHPPVDAAGANPHPHLFPEPRLAVGEWPLKNQRATAAIDISDGLSTDLDHLCQESGLAATIDASAIPVHPLAGKSRSSPTKTSLELALNGGEDYELLFTAAATAKIPRHIAGIPIACIGAMQRYNPRRPRMMLIEQKNGREYQRPFVAGGWEHYK